MSAQSTRDLIVAKADTLFYETGFEATSFTDIASAIGISRGNFYHHFKTKDDILDSVITLRLSRTRAMLARWEDQAPDARGRILCFIHILIANQSKIMAYGCPVGTLCAELAKLDHVSKDRATEVFVLFRDWLTDQFSGMGAGMRAGQLALHILAWSQGVASLATAFQDKTFVDEEIAGITRWLDETAQQFNPA